MYFERSYRCWGSSYVVCVNGSNVCSVLNFWCEWLCNFSPKNNLPALLNTGCWSKAAQAIWTRETIASPELVCSKALVWKLASNKQRGGKRVHTYCRHCKHNNFRQSGQRSASRSKHRYKSSPINRGVCISPGLHGAGWLRCDCLVYSHTVAQAFACCTSGQGRSNSSIRSNRSSNSSSSC